MTLVLRLGYKKHYGQTVTAGRGTRYSLPTEAKHRALPLFDQIDRPGKSSEHYDGNSEHYAQDSEHYDKLLNIANSVREKGRADKEIVRNTILELCAEEFLSLRTFADLLNRDPDSIRNHYLRPLLKEGFLTIRFQETPNHPQQGYKTTDTNR